MANELAIIKTNYPAFDPEGFELTAAEVFEEMDGDMPDYPTIKIPAGGITSFEIPSDDPESPEMVKSLTGVIVYHHKSNAWWDGDGTPTEGQAPDCVSYDGKTGTGRPGGDCMTCPLNTFGSGEGGKGKACKNTERLYLVTDESILPFRITVSPASLKAYRQYKTSQVMKGRKVCDIVTEISLKKVTNGAGQPYSECVFKTVGLLDPETKELARKKREEVKVMASAMNTAQSNTVARDLMAEGFTEVEASDVEGIPEVVL